MEKLVVIVFGNDEAKAYEGLRFLQELDRDDEITLYHAEVVVKTSDGLSRVTSEDDKRAVPLVGGGTAVGALIGLLGGPIGAAVGATAGAVAGGIRAIEETGVTDEFIQDVSGALTPGKAAVIADIEENWTTALDTRMEEIGGLVFRRARTLAKTTQHDSDAAAHRAEMEQLKAERAQARSDRLAKIDAKIDRLRVKLANAVERKRVKMQERQHEREARIRALQAKANEAHGEVRKRQEARIAELRHEYAEKASVG